MRNGFRIKVGSSQRLTSTFVMSGGNESGETLKRLYDVKATHDHLTLNSFSDLMNGRVEEPCLMLPQPQISINEPLIDLNPEHEEYLETLRGEVITATGLPQSIFDYSGGVEMKDITITKVDTDGDHPILLAGIITEKGPEGQPK